MWGISTIIPYQDVAKQGSVRYEDTILQGFLYEILQGTLRCGYSPQWGQFVKEHGYGHEEFNFYPRFLEGKSDEVCLGFVEPKSNRGKRNTLHLENIESCAAAKDEPFVEDVLVIWCATRQQRDTTVVGWYKHATVWRVLQDWVLVFEDDKGEERGYNVLAKSSECVLLPEGERNRAKWSIPSARYTRAYGFGQSMVWYPTEEEAKPYLKRLIESINSYHEENWLYKFLGN